MPTPPELKSALDAYLRAGENLASTLERVAPADENEFDEAAYEISIRMNKQGDYNPAQVVAFIISRREYHEEFEEENGFAPPASL